MPSAEQVHFASIAGDGVVLCWDTRKAQEAPDGEPKADGKANKKEGWGPTAKMALLHPDGSGELSPTHCLLDVPEAFDASCRLFCATEEGEFVTIELANPGQENFVKGVRSVIPGHYGPCVSLQRSPFLPTVHMSVGDWTFNLWKEGVASPLFISPFASCLLSCGAWSPSRPAVLFIGRADGGIDIWDLLDRSHEPSMSVNITSAAVTSMKFHVSASRQLLAVGDDQGTVHVMEVPRNLRRAANNEKSFALNFFVREEKRVEYMQRRFEMRAEEGVAKKEAEKEAAAAAPPVGKEAEEGAPAAEPEDKLELAFRAMERQFMEEMGLNRPLEDGE